ncbi:MAG: cytochrome c [Bacteriovoracaceae bacterium]
MWRKGKIGMGMLKLIISLMLVISCSHVNQESHDFYMGDYKIRHGIVPIPMNSNINSNKNETSFPIDKEKAKRGKFVYSKNCLECHGIKGEGDGEKANSLPVKPKNLVNSVRSVPNFKLYVSVSQWVGKMPGWKNHLTDEELEDLTHYLKELAL